MGQVIRVTSIDGTVRYYKTFREAAENTGCKISTLSGYVNGGKKSRKGLKVEKVRSQRVYMRVSKDKYRLPEAVADTPQQLAKICGTSATTIVSVVSKWKSGKYKNPRYEVVEVYDDD